MVQLDPRGHAVLAEALVSAAAKILRQHGNVDFLDKLVQVAGRAAQAQAQPLVRELPASFPQAGHS
jgi:hypothetical protein